jgi:IS1 family transposase
MPGSTKTIGKNTEDCYWYTAWMLFVKRIIENTLGKRVLLRFRQKFPTRVILIKADPDP